MVMLLNKLLLLIFLCGMCFGYLVAFVRETYK